MLHEPLLQGKLEFDVERGTLEIKVKPQKAENTETKEVDTSSLSGGEKSFSTVCFILALWQEAALPFHFLDEFDVFMVSAALEHLNYLYYTKLSLCPKIVPCVPKLRFSILKIIECSQHSVQCIHVLILTISIYKFNDGYKSGKR